MIDSAKLKWLDVELSDCKLVLSLTVLVASVICPQNDLSLLRMSHEIEVVLSEDRSPVGSLASIHSWPRQALLASY